jgi:hypothetical protein
MVPEGMTSDGINREHGEDDPNGAETVAAPATVSGLPDVLVVLLSSAMPLRKRFALRGKADVRRIFASQETCRQNSVHHPGRGCPERSII